MNRYASKLNGLKKWMAFVGMAIIFQLKITTVAAEPSAADINHLIKAVSPSIVNIHNQFSVIEKGKKTLHHSIASGSIIDAQHGYIVTNAHAIEGNEADIQVELFDGRRFNAKIIGQSHLTDLAILKIDAGQLTAIPLGSMSSVFPGQEVFVIGSAFGFKHSVTKGIISATQRGGIEKNAIENYIQTDAPINPGNSGGPLINLKGEMIGVNVSMYTPGKGNAGIGFAIPINIVKNVAHKLIQYGKVEYSTLGIKVIDVHGGMSTASNLNIYQGAVIVAIIPNSPAALANLKMGDIIIGMNGEKILTASQLQSQIHLLKPDERVEYEIARTDGNIEKITLSTRRLDEFNAKIVSDNQFLNDFNLETMQIYNPIWGHLQGVKISYVRPGSLAELNQFKKDDMIIAVNFQSIDGVAKLRHLLNLMDKKNPQAVYVSVLRGFDIIVLKLQPESNKHFNFIEYI